MVEKRDNSSSNVEKRVLKHYSSIAKRLIVSNHPVHCCGGIQDDDSCCGYKTQTIPSFGSDKDLLGKASAQPGEVVVDLGSGAGHDLIKVAKRVGPKGRAIGVDFSEDMINLAQENVKKEGLENVDFIQSHLTRISLPDNTADLVISNCVFNLVEDKPAAFKEAYRILRPGGMFIISDQITHLKEDQNVNISTQCGCIGGARSIEEYIDYMRDAGFFNIDHEVEFEGNVKISGNNVKFSSVLFLGYK